MKKEIRLFIAAAFVCAGVIALCPAARAIEIPIEGGVLKPAAEGSAASASSGGIAYVDIEMIFNEHPMTKRLKGEFEAEVEKRKKALSEMEASSKFVDSIVVSSTTEITKLKSEIEQVKQAIADKDKPAQTVLLPGTSNLITLPVLTSTNTAKADPAIIEADEKIIKDKESGIALLKDEYSKKRKEIEEKIRSDKEYMTKLEDSNTKDVLNDIYKILEKLASDYNLTIVVDKNNVLYGQASMDLTERVRDRMRGR